jgi:tRNA A-37 threonylcarbamoyl transferase component Bud32
VGRTIVDDRYELLALVGSGGMAEVYLACDVVLDREVALKLLKARYAQDEEFVERFRREAKSAASLASPYVVPIFDRGETDDGTYYIAMEYVPGGTLKDRIRTEGALPPRVATEVGLQVAQALKSAHEKGIIHRDVKPDNILFADSGHAKVADFGIARAAEATTISHVGDILGSVKYMSPEQAAGERVGPESDLYSLGTVLYEMLTNSAPFEIGTPADVPAAHAGGPPGRPRELNPEVPEGLDAIVMKLLSKEPADRYGSAAQLAEDLGRARDGIPPASPSAGATPFYASTDAPTTVLNPTASSSVTSGTAGMARRRTLWISILFTVLVCALAIVGWGALQAGDLPSLLAPGGRVGGPPRGSEGAQGGHQEVEVPAVKGLSKQAARRRLDEAGFRVAVKPQESSQEVTDRVLEQSVAGGKRAREGSKIVLTVGGGSRVAKVPALVGLTYSEAKTKLERAGFLLGGVKEIQSATVSAGVIAGQDPKAGTALNRGSYVYLTTSLGPPMETTTGF